MRARGWIIEGRQAVQYQDIVQTVLQLRPEWNGQAIFAAIRSARDKTGCEMVTLAAVASLVALDRTARTPNAIGNHPALVGGTLTGRRPDGQLDPDRPSLHPDLTGDPQLCDHGVDQRERTSDDHPRCPYCRGVTRIMRNGSNEPSRVAAHPPLPSVERGPRHAAAE